MRHNHNRTNADAKGSDPADRAAADVAGMGWDELCEVVGTSPAGDSAYATEYFEQAAREIVRRMDAGAVGAGEVACR
jgi:uncharacterized protein (UPF0297 family)